MNEGVTHVYSSTRSLTAMTCFLQLRITSLGLFFFIHTKSRWSTWFHSYSLQSTWNEIRVRTVLTTNCTTFAGSIPKYLRTSWWLYSCNCCSFYFLRHRKCFNINSQRWDKHLRSLFVLTLYWEQLFLDWIVIWKARCSWYKYLSALLSFNWN